MPSAKKDDLRVFEAKPLAQAPDKGHIKWPKRKIRMKKKLTRKPSKRDYLVKKRYYHPSTEQARFVLLEYGRDFERCEQCGRREVKVAIHHIDKNPYNNNIENLKILCMNCHGHVHIDDERGVIDEEWTLMLDDE